MDKFLYDTERKLVQLLLKESQLLFNKIDKELNNNTDTISTVGRTELDVRVYSDEKSDIEKSIVNVGMTRQLISLGNINSSEETIMLAGNINAGKNWRTWKYWLCLENPKRWSMCWTIFGWNETWAVFLSAGETTKL